MTCSNSDWNIRLFNGFDEATESEGRVEVYINETWRVVCDSKWNWNDSVVVCRQLGYGQPISSKRRFPTTRNDVLIYTNGRLCKGNETALHDCDLQIEQPQQTHKSCQEAVVLCNERKCRANANLYTVSNNELNNFLDCSRGWFLYAGYCYTLSPKPIAFDNFYNLGDNLCSRL